MWKHVHLRAKDHALSWRGQRWAGLSGVCVSADCVVFSGDQKGVLAWARKRSNYKGVVPWERSNARLYVEFYHNWKRYQEKNGLTVFSQVSIHTHLHTAFHFTDSCFCSILSAMDGLFPVNRSSRPCKRLTRIPPRTPRYSWWVCVFCALYFMNLAWFSVDEWWAKHPCVQRGLMDKCWWVVLQDWISLTLYLQMMCFGTIRISTDNRSRHIGAVLQVILSIIIAWSRRHPTC